MKSFNFSSLMLILLTKFAFLWEIGISFSINNLNHQPLLSSKSKRSVVRHRGNTHLCSSFRNEDGINSDEDNYSDDDDDEKWILPTFTGNDDWRSFRAKLVLQEHYIETAKTEEQTQQWAYQQPNLEKGAILIQDPFSTQFEPKKDLYTSSLLDHIHWYKSVVIVLDSNARETTGLIINRPANLTLTPAQGFTSTMLYGGSTASFHCPDHRILCLHRNDALKEESTAIISGLYLLSFEEAKQAISDNRAVPADFLYISGHEKFRTPTLNKHLRDGHWRSLTTDALTLQKAIVPDAWTTLLTMTGSPPPTSMHQTHSSDDVIVLDALLREWNQKCLYYWSPINPMHDPANLQQSPQQRSSQHHPEQQEQYPPPIPHPIKAGDMLRGSSMDHAFLFDHQEFHKSVVLVLDVIPEKEDEHPAMAVSALLSYPTVDIDPMTGLPIRHGGNENCNEKNDGEDVYCLHFLGSDTVRNSQKIGSNFYRCKLNDAVDAMNNRKAQREDFLVLRGTVSFPLENAALDVVPADAAPAIWHTLSHQRPLSPFVMEENIQIARHAWVTAGGKEMMPPTPINDLGKETVRAWLASNLLVASSKYNNFKNGDNSNPNDLSP